MKTRFKTFRHPLNARRECVRVCAHHFSIARTPRKITNREAARGSFARIHHFQQIECTHANVSALPLPVMTCGSREIGDSRLQIDGNGIANRWI